MTDDKKTTTVTIFGNDGPVNPQFSNAVEVSSLGNIVQIDYAYYSPAQFGNPNSHRERDSVTHIEATLVSRIIMVQEDAFQLVQLLQNLLAESGFSADGSGE